MTELRPAPTGTTTTFGQLLSAALDYVERWHWDLAVGATAIRVDGGWTCSCRVRTCPTIGGHPLHQDWQKRISGAPSRAHEWWTAHPDASIVLPTGRTFDVLDVPEQAGCLALARLERMGALLGPVIATPDRRLRFLVQPGAKAGLPALLTAAGWGRVELDLICHGERGYVLAPPSRVASAPNGAVGRTQWVRPPAEENRWLPEAATLIPTLAYACGRELYRRVPAQRR
jgi:hypothetical protein